MGPGGGSGRSAVCPCVPLEWRPLPAARRRVAAFAAALTGAVLCLLPQAASADLLAPESPASSEAGAMRTAYVVMAVVALLLALAVIAAVLRVVRRSRGREADNARRTRGTSGVQRRVGIGLGAAALVLFVLGVVLGERAREAEAQASAEPIAIDAFGQQWLWRYEYPGGEEAVDDYSGDEPYSYQELVVPVDTPIELSVGSTDVIHRWWVPALARSAEAVPGQLNTISFTADETGTYEGRSTEFSGPGYATMRTEVHVVEPDEYQAFLKQRTQEIIDARQAVQDRVDAGTAPGVQLEE